MGLKSEERICPICGKDNGCQHGERDCWCTHVKVPKYIIEMVAEDKRGKACICKECIEKYSK